MQVPSIRSVQLGQADILDVFHMDAKGCWLFRGRLLRGYGVWNSKMAHRAMYELLVGPIPDGLQLHHTCGVTSCVNPNHLRPVTAAENTRLSSRAKITAEQAAQIKRALMGAGPAAIARKFGVTISIVENIKYGRRWRDIEPAAAFESSESIAA